jgi:hypothetical protein
MWLLTPVTGSLHFHTATWSRYFLRHLASWPVSFPPGANFHPAPMGISSCHTNPWNRQNLCGAWTARLTALKVWALSLFREAWSWVKEDLYSTNLIRSNSDGKIGLVQISTVPQWGTNNCDLVFSGGACKRCVRLVHISALGKCFSLRTRGVHADFKKA